MKNDDEDIISAYNWIRNFISEKDWLRRKSEIENHLTRVVRSTKPFSEPITSGTLLVIQKDQIGWYLYLVYTYIFEPYKHESYQGARVVPIFKRIGMDLDLVKSIDGVNKKIRDLLKKRTSEADAFLFEILTALMWARNGWNVKFLEEGKAGKTPDFAVSKGEQYWQVECKRQKKTTGYAYKESEKRQLMISQITQQLLEHNILLDIIFHVELVSLPDSYLKEKLQHKIPLVTMPGKLISDQEVDIDVSFVDIQTIEKHLDNNYVKNGSPQLLELIAKRPVDSSAFTSGFQGDFVYIGDGEANNEYVSEIVKAFGVHCRCDAPEAVFAKAKDVRNQLHDAIGQFGPDANAVVHIGMETYEGPEVEKKRFEKISKTMTEINPADRRLRWIFYHFFQSYSRPNKDWFFDETVTKATAFVNQRPPIHQTFLVVPEAEDVIEDASHWEREAP